LGASGSGVRGEGWGGYRQFLTCFQPIFPL
jgi:hypothetical protein